MSSLIPTGATWITAFLCGVAPNGAPFGNPSAETFSGDDLVTELDDWLTEVMPAETGISYRGVDVGRLYPDARGYLYADVRDPETGRVVASLRIYAGRKAVSYPTVDLTVSRSELPRIDEAA